MQGVNSEKKLNTFPVNPHWNTRFKSYAFAEELDQSLREALLDAEGLLLQSTVIKNSRSTSAGIFHLNGIDYFIKRSNAKSLIARLRRIGRMSRARRNRLMAAELEKIGVLTPKVYMTLDIFPCCLPGACYLITECFPHPITVFGKIKELWGFYGSNKALIDALTCLAAKLHDNGIEHGDLKLTNILALKDAENSFDLGVFDLDGCKK